MRIAYIALLAVAIATSCGAKYTAAAHNVSTVNWFRRQLPSKRVHAVDADARILAVDDNLTEPSSLLDDSLGVQLHDRALDIERFAAQSSTFTYNHGNGVQHLFEPATNVQKVHVPLSSQLALPLLILSAGLFLMGSSSELGILVGKFACYSGMQVTMNLFMKATLSEAYISEDRQGFSAPFAITAIQQITSLSLLSAGILISRLTAKPYTVKSLSTKSEYFSVMCLSLTFVLNIALNNYSLMLLDVSVNIAIRSLQAVTTYLTQLGLARMMNDKPNFLSPLQLTCLTIGMLCALCTVYAKTGGVRLIEANSLLGVLVCFLSLGAASLNMCLVAILNTRSSLNSLDSLYYMSLPAFLFLLLPLLYIPHPVTWTNVAHVTDFWVIQQVWKERPMLILLAVLSGVFALLYNCLLYFIIQTMSATQAAFAGNFNQAATIVLALASGLEQVPTAIDRRALLAFGVIGNAIAFCSYTVAGFKQKQLGPCKG